MGQPSFQRPRHIKAKAGADAAARRVVASLDGADVLAPGPEFVPRSFRPGEIKYHIANVPYATSEFDLREFFAARVGPVTECHIFRDNVSGESRGFAVLRCLGDALVLDGTMFEGRELKIEKWDR
jgi:hypothetical protein